MVGVNTDADRESAVLANKKANIEWRSFWDGPKGAHGPISSKWNIDSFPTYFILDEKGVIRYRDVADEEVDLAIEKMLQEMGQTKKIIHNRPMEMFQKAEIESDDRGK